jgi:probable phosphoglycerate mutase
MPGVELDDIGREQACKLPARLKPAPIAAIYASPLERTMQTAEPLSHTLDLPVIPRERLIEVNFGDWTGKTMLELDNDPLWHKFNALRSITRAPGGDLMLDVQTRIVDELEELRMRHPDQTVAIFSHQDAIKAALAHYGGIPLDLFHRFEISPASVSILRLADWGPQIVCINSTGEF